MAYNIKKILHFIFRQQDHAQLLDSINKIGINLVTAGAAGLFISNQLHWSTGRPSVLLIVVGVISILIGTTKRGEN